MALNATALCAQMPADLVFANHVLLGAAVGWASGMPFAVKAHGSELEYSMRGNDDLAAWGRECLALPKPSSSGPRTSATCWRRSSATSSACTRCRPGSTSRSFGPPLHAKSPSHACWRKPAQIAANPANANERQPDDGNAARLEEFFATDEPTVVYFGKLLHNKGVHVLLEALRTVDARAVIVGFGDYRQELELIAPPGTLFTGPLEHRHLVHLLPLADVTVVPSIFPEAFGMVAAEAAAAGSPPLVARHSGLAEVAEGLEAEYPVEHRHLASFASGDAADLAAKLAELLALSSEARAELGAAARRTAVERWSWTSIAARLLEPIGGG